MAGARLAALPHELRAKFLLLDPSEYCAASKETLATCDQFWIEVVATEKHYWENQYMVGDVKGVPADTVRQDMRKFDKRRVGFARILDLIHRRDGVKLEEDKIPKDVSLSKAYEHLHGARDWAPRHWADREAFADASELIAAFFHFEMGGEERAEAIERYGEPEAWIITNVTDLSALDYSFFNKWSEEREEGDDDFYLGPEFNEPIGAWDTSSVTNMAATFRDFRKFNQPIGAWDTSKVESMGEMFMTALNFNQPIGDWKTGKVESMESMFRNAYSFNQPIGAWNTSSVEAMTKMFFGANNFNQPIGAWDTSSVKRMDGMFTNATAFNQRIGGWDTSKVVTMERMFDSAASFNQGLGSWDTSNVQHMVAMFVHSAFDQDVSSWSLERLKDASITAIDDYMEGYKTRRRIERVVERARVATKRARALGSAQLGSNVSGTPTRLNVVDAVFASHCIGV